jgi:hypothetical protein
MGSGQYTRQACPGCGHKTLTMGMFAFAAVPKSEEVFDCRVFTCRTCKCDFIGPAGGLLRGGTKTPTAEMMFNRAKLLRYHAEDLDRQARAALEAAARARAGVEALLQWRGALEELESLKAPP